MAAVGATDLRQLIAVLGQEPFRFIQSAFLTSRRSFGANVGFVGLVVQRRSSFGNKQLVPR
jgi:hypothetical protein